MGSACDISVGVPTYNQGEYVGKTIESLLEQDEAPAEIVVSDNHSDDQTARVLAQFGSRIRVVRPPEHLPMMSQNWNYLISQMRADWVALISSDDVALPSFVRTLARGTRADESAVMVAGGWQRIDGAGRVLRSTPRVSTDRIRRPPENFLDQLRSYVARFGATAVHREAWRKVGGFPEELHFACDWGLWLRLSPRGSFVYEPGVIFQCRQEYRPPEVVRSRLGRCASDTIRIYESIIPPLAREHGVENHDGIAQAEREHCYHFLATGSRMLEQGELEQFCQIVRAWSDRCGYETEFERLLAGERLPRKPYGRFRLLASNAAELLKSARLWRRPTTVISDSRSV